MLFELMPNCDLHYVHVYFVLQTKHSFCTKFVFMLKYNYFSGLQINQA